MTVTPRYEAYPDACNTGLTVPLQLPSSSLPADTSAQSQHHSQEQSLSQQHSPRAALQGWASLYHCRHKGVDRVFVDHPILLCNHDTDRTLTYLHGASESPNLDLQYSILCQAALAAPVLLWHQPQAHLRSMQLQALLRSLPQTLSGGIAQYIGADAASLTVTAPAVRGSQKTSESSRASLASSSTECDSMIDALTSSTGAMQSPVPGACAHSGRSPGALKSQHSSDAHISGASADIMWPASAGNIAYVGNDWPCFPLSQHLRKLQSIHTEAGAQPQIGPPQASTALACAAANSFETQMARLLKNSRVAFCIHNLAYQGIFAQVRCRSLVLEKSPVLQCVTVRLLHCAESAL